MGIFDKLAGATMQRASVSTTAVMIENNLGPLAHGPVSPEAGKELYTKLKSDIEGFKDSGDKKVMEELLSSLNDGDGWTKEETERFSAHYQQAKANEPSESSLFDKFKAVASSAVQTSASEATTQTSV